jgi:hypothetical protein
MSNHTELLDESRGGKDLLLYSVTRTAVTGGKGEGGARPASMPGGPEQPSGPKRGGGQAAYLAALDLTLPGCPPGSNGAPFT